MAYRASWDEIRHILLREGSWNMLDSTDWQSNMLRHAPNFSLFPAMRAAMTEILLASISTMAEDVRATVSPSEAQQREMNFLRQQNEALEQRITIRDKQIETLTKAVNGLTDYLCKLIKRLDTKPASVVPQAQAIPSPVVRRQPPLQPQVALAPASMQPPSRPRPTAVQSATDLSVSRMLAQMQMSDDPPSHLP